MIIFTVALSIGTQVSQAQDRQKEVVMRYPDACFTQNGGTLIDITKSPYNARGSGKESDATHNTKAFEKAYDFVMAELDKIWIDGQNPSGKDEIDASFIIYIPEGTYYVNDTIIYSGEFRVPPQGPGEKLIWMRFIGENRNNTVIRLADSSPGFNDPETPKPVIAFGKGHFNNKNAKNAIRNLTVDVGNSNSGAIGILMGGANNASGENLTVRSPAGDNQRKGHTGIHFGIGTVIGYYRDITVDGFDTGIHIGASVFTGPMLEHVTVKHAKQQGVLVDGEASSATLRKFLVRRGKNAIRLASPGSHVVLLESEFREGKETAAAIQIDSGVLFARKVSIEDYGVSVLKEGSPVTSNAILSDGNIGQYVSEKISKYDSETPNWSLNMKIEDVPFPEWERDLSRWVTAGDGNDRNDDAPEIRKVLEENPQATTLYFPGKRYVINSTIEIPAHITHVNFMFGEILGSAEPKFKIAAASSTPIVFRDLQFLGSSFHKFGIEQAGSRTMILDNASGFKRTTTDREAALFVNNGNFGHEVRTLKGAKAYFRYTNIENKDPAYTFENSDVIVLGYKTESGGRSFFIKGGSRVEILGGNSNQQSAGWEGNNRAFDIVNSEVSAVFATSGGNLSNGQYFEQLILDRKNEMPVSIPYEDAINREHKAGIIVPLYNTSRYPEEDVPESLIEVGLLDHSQENKDAWRRVSFAREFSEPPVVIMGTPSFNGNQESTMRVRNVTTASFEFQLDEWDYLDGGHVSESIGWMAVLPGVHQIGGETWNAIRVNDVNHDWKSQSFGENTNYAGAHLVFAQVMTLNGTQAATIRLRNVSDTGLQVRLQEEEANDGTHNPEEVGLVVISNGEGTIDGKKFFGKKTDDSITQGNKTLSFNEITGKKAVFSAIRSYDGADPAALRYTDLTDTSVKLFIEEEQSQDEETDHTTETVSWFVIQAD